MWFKSLFSSLALVQVFATLASATDGDLDNRGAIHESTGCWISSSYTSEGFYARFYNYTFDQAYDEAFVEYGYADYGKLIATAENVKDIDILYPTTPAGVLYGDIYGDNLTISNFTLILTGYFYAKETGYYNFDFHTTDDAVVLYFASDAAFDCCNSKTLSTHANFSDSVIYTTGSIASDGLDYDASRQTYLEGGYYYPTRIDYINIVHYANLQLTVTYPNGEKVTTFGDSVYQFDEEDSTCVTVTPSAPARCTRSTIHSTFVASTSKSAAASPSSGSSSSSVAVASTSSTSATVAAEASTSSSAAVVVESSAATAIATEASSSSSSSSSAAVVVESSAASSSAATAIATEASSSSSSSAAVVVESSASSSSATVAAEASTSSSTTSSATVAIETSASASSTASVQSYEGAASRVNSLSASILAFFISCVFLF
ncbi:Tda8 protein [Saccharomycopsis crataegensis]|uniref:Tda8 protein n=1 Tax=Saccharomycopsis crataegensis TaxID=43959 RepID=A0AAV5QKH5_9ASCO|nr:Tda8 protein [Saccharomycopsis crataegensis]